MPSRFFRIGYALAIRAISPALPWVARFSQQRAAPLAISAASLALLTPSFVLAKEKKDKKDKKKDKKAKKAEKKAEKKAAKKAKKEEKNAKKEAKKLAKADKEANKTYDTKKVAKNASKKKLWVVHNGQVYDLSAFAKNRKKLPITCDKGKPCVLADANEFLNLFKIGKLAEEK